MIVRRETDVRELHGKATQQQTVQLRCASGNTTTAAEVKILICAALPRLLLHKASLSMQDLRKQIAHLKEIEELANSAALTRATHGPIWSYPSAAALLSPSRGDG